MLSPSWSLYCCCHHAARNPNAAAILAQAAQTAAKREARLAAQPKLPKGSKGKGKRKKSGNEVRLWDSRRALGTGSAPVGCAPVRPACRTVERRSWVCRLNCTRCHSGRVFPPCCPRAALQDTDGEDDGEGWEDSEEEGGKRRSRQRQRKHYGDEFVVGLDEAWNDASQSDDDYQPNAEGVSWHARDRQDAACVSFRSVLNRV